MTDGGGTNFTAQSQQSLNLNITLTINAVSLYINHFFCAPFLGLLGI
jgi:hypothetical protein